MDEQGQTEGEQINEEELETVNGGFNMYATLQKGLPRTVSSPVVVDSRLQSFGL